ncbi:IS1 family transposase [Crocinitomicaceae bacterium]|nr:IS1 family transposase [Crocinitomicaceae bacterium]MDC1282757.1 IS1 family transposase [Crocinitomicaceae bacterium]
MKCCNSEMIKNGKTKANIQRYICKLCSVTAQEEYSYNACVKCIDQNLILLIKEGCGIRSISRILNISPTTVLKRIMSISNSIQKPPISFGKTYEVDEMMTFIGNKERRICITYALERQTKEVVSFSVGRRNKRTLGMVINTLLISDAKQIRTDKCPTYLSLIPKAIHHVKKRGINYIERNNLTLRTHLKRLNRKTIAYSKSMLVLSAILKIYFWS